MTETWSLTHLDIRTNIFACLLSIHNTISLSRHEQVSLSGLGFERYFSHLWLTQIIMLRLFKGKMQKQ